MRAYYSVKHWLKLGRWRFRRWQTSQRWGADILDKMPRIFGNAIPKAGSHLIIQVLLGLTKIGPAVNPGFPPVNRFEDNTKLSRDSKLANINKMLPGDVGYGYIHSEDLFVQTLTEPEFATIFIYRDPRDVIVSSVFYATEIHKDHGMHPYYTEVLKTNEQRINAEIEGVKVPGFEYDSIQKRYASYFGWLNQPEVLSIKFSDLILERNKTLELMLNYLINRGFEISMTHAEAIEMLTQSIAPSKSGTFRKGQPGSWREHFTKQNKASFKENSGDLLIRWGFEQDMDW